jgi:hypothetical protein
LLVIFGHSIARSFTGKNHHDKAVAWVNKWNDHLNREWMQVRETAATIMQNFITELLKLGVGKEIIDKAIREVESHATV